MKKLLLAAVLVSAMSCGGNVEGSGDEDKDMGTRSDSVNNTPEGGAGDTTATTNNNAYNTDSASGQGTTYDTASNNKEKQ